MLRPCPRILAITLAGSALLIASTAEADVVALHMEGGQACVQVFLEFERMRAD